MDTRRHSEECVTISGDRAQFTVRVPSTDIAATVLVSLRQKILTVIAIVLVVSDIPRAGLTITPEDYYDRVGPGIVMYWGPYEYHVAHLKAHDGDNSNSTHPGIEASCDGAPLETLDLWPYKADTLSIAPRALAEYLNVTSYPRCVLYQGPCQTLTLEPSIVFHMLDDLSTKVRERFFSANQSPVTFATKSNWVDRLHHYLFRFVTDNPDNRLHAVYHSSLSNTTENNLHGVVDELEAPRQAKPYASAPCVIPFLCTSPVKWICAHPKKPEGRRTIPIWEHIGARIDELARQYPDAKLDFTMFTSSLIEQTRRNSQYVPSVSYLTDTIEVTTLIRGKRCDDSQKCKTVFVDDYRYERSWIESDANQWTSYLWLLRGSSQLYIWIRILALLCGCVYTSYSEPQHNPSNFCARCVHVWSILVRVPGHAIVYGSWAPLVMYSFAHYFDSSFVQSVGEFAWSSVGGLDTFNLVKYVSTMSIQMRNIWMIALLWKAIVAFGAACLRGRCTSIDPTRVGLVSFRSGWIGIVSWLTTFALMRAIRFRNTAVLSVNVLARHIPIESFRPLPVYHNFVDYGPRFDLKCAVLATVVCVCIGWTVKTAVRVISGRATALFWSRSHYIPRSAGVLWPWAILDGVWALTLRDGTVRGTSSTRPSPSLVMPYHHHQPPDALHPSSAACVACGFRSSVVHWRATQGCALHEPLADVSRRSRALWSVVRLTNLAAMTDPIALVRLYVVGTPLYVYRVGDDDDAKASYLLLQPTPPRTPRDAQETGQTNAMGMHLVGVVDSRNVPWRALINCG